MSKTVPYPIGPHTGLGTRWNPQTLRRGTSAGLRTQFLWLLLGVVLLSTLTACNTLVPAFITSAGTFTPTPAVTDTALGSLGNGCGGFVPGRVLVASADQAQVLADDWVGVATVHPLSRFLQGHGLTLVQVPVGREQEYIAELDIPAWRDVLLCLVPTSRHPHTGHSRSPTGAANCRSLAGAADDPRYGEQWHLPVVRWAQAREDWSSQGAQVVVAVVDSGVDYAHPDLALKVVSGYDFVDDDADPLDGHGHGTHVAGIAAASTDNGTGVAGVCWSDTCKIMPVRVCNDEGGCPLSAVAAGVYWAADNGANVINLSLGGAYYEPEVEAINYAWESGLVVVAAAGNNNSSADFWPAAADNCIAVGAVARPDGTTKSSFSNYGDWVDVAFPGDAILSTCKNADYCLKWGTSMASPGVAGMAALLWSYHPDWDNARVREAVEQTARDIDQELGHGLVDVSAALAYGGPPPAPPPTPTSTPVPTSPPPAPPAPTATSTLPPGAVLLEVTPAPGAVGWVVNTEPASNHFDDDDTYTGDYSQHVYHGAIQFPLAGLPSGATVLSAEVILTGQSDAYLDREADGVWTLKLLDPSVDAGWKNHGYTVISGAGTLAQVGAALSQEDLAPYRENALLFPVAHLALLEERARTTGLASFRLDTADTGDNNVFSWDSGYGEGGIGRPPVLRIVYVPSGVPPTATLTATPWPPTVTSTPSPSPTPTEEPPRGPTPTSTPEPFWLYCEYGPDGWECRHRQP